MLNETQTVRAQETLAELAAPIEIELDAGVDPASAFSQNLRDVVASLVEASAGKLKLITIDSDGARAAAGLRIDNVRYLAVPEGPELAPFLDFLVTKSKPVGETDNAGDAFSPIEMTLFVAPACPNCPKVATIRLGLASRHREITLSIVDAQQFPELAGTCRSVPMLIIDRMHTIVGQTSQSDLLAVLQRRDAPDAFERALTAMIDAGRHKEAATELSREAGLLALPHLLANGTFQQRMGLMMTVEEALDTDPEVLNDAVPHLLQLASTDDTTIRGDLADLLGQIGAPSARNALESLARDKNEDVREIAEESLSMLRD